MVSVALAQAIPAPALAILGLDPVSAPAMAPGSGTHHVRAPGMGAATTAVTDRDSSAVCFAVFSKPVKRKPVVRSTL